MNLNQQPSEPSTAEHELDVRSEVIACILMVPLSAALFFNVPRPSLLAGLAPDAVAFLGRAFCTAWALVASAQVLDRLPARIYRRPAFCMLQFMSVWVAAELLVAGGLVASLGRDRSGLMIALGATVLPTIALVEFSVRWSLRRDEENPFQMFRLNQPVGFTRAVLCLSPFVAFCSIGG
ncbi:hypothetical protein [Niveibacterium sp. COAC-50]|uniref:hypothetical protein n=1 Tax=Niveibacterium sp. COAC-50 TaxID=2729384 RepID=UPI001553D239|nr:hypothetical protein [Niveibacterium sp. COAC-50]